MPRTKQLDFCRIKKIFDKGYGFLTSLYHDENIFFHFSKIKDFEKRQLLNNMKRGEVLIYYTSKTSNGKRQVDNVWLNLAEVPQSLLPDFITRLIVELNNGTINLFEIIAVFNQLRKLNKISKENFKKIISSKRISENPSVLLKIIDEKEIDISEKLKKTIYALEHSEIGFFKFQKELNNIL
jgi:cold shock CspA family protein